MSKHLRHTSPTSRSSSSSSAKLTGSSLGGDVPPAKYAHITPGAAAPVAVPAMQCNLMPHAEAVCFGTWEAFESHYQREHTNRCATCSRNFPSGHFLDLHHEEHHNPLRELLSERGEKTYGCFVEGCDRKCSTPQKRRLHLIDKHMFPRNYNFRVIDSGIDKATTMLREGRRRRVTATSDHARAGEDRRSTGQKPLAISDQSSTGGYRDATSEAEVRPSRGADDVIEQAPRGEPRHCPVDLDGLTNSMSALRFVPASVLRHSQHRDLFKN